MTDVCDEKNYGDVYLYNMTDRTMNIVVNGDREAQLVICPMKFKIEEPGDTYHPRPRKSLDDERNKEKVEMADIRETLQNQES